MGTLGRTYPYIVLALLLMAAFSIRTGLYPVQYCSGALRSPTDPILSLGSELPETVAFGNAGLEGRKRRGWWIGNFEALESRRHATQVEMKWAHHKTGVVRRKAASNLHATSISILISGKHRLEFGRSSVLLEKQGDYVLWGPGIPHSWTCVEDSTTLTVRWPSLAQDQVEFTNATSIRTRA